MLNAYFGEDCGALQEFWQILPKGIGLLQKMQIGGIKIDSDREAGKFC